MKLDVRVYRRDELGQPDALADGGVLQVTTGLGAMLQGECPEGHVVDMIEGLLGGYGSVAKSAGTTGYKYVFCEDPDPRWKFVCTAPTQFAVNDGGASPVIVDVVLTSFFPFT